MARRLTASLHVNHWRHQREAASVMKDGLERHGVSCFYAEFGKPAPSDFAVVWGVKQKTIFTSGRPVLVMERGHIQDRMFYTSCGWNGLARRGLYPRAADGGARWRRLFGRHLRDWRTHGSHVVVCGQMPGDTALHGADIHRWARTACRDAKAAFGLPLMYRPHPLVKPSNSKPPRGVPLSSAPLADDLARAAVVVTYNSTAGVEAVLAGVPTVTCDEGAMAWPVTSHEISAPLVRPAREDWCADLAWTQWAPEEMADGTAWDALKQTQPQLS
jgi:hypothetical protein